jgi:hypothetical protein
MTFKMHCKFVTIRYLKVHTHAWPDGQTYLYDSGQKLDSCLANPNTTWLTKNQNIADPV